MLSFWDRSWEQIDTGRLVQYIQTFDSEPDSITEELLARRGHTVCDAGCGCGIYARQLLSRGFAVSGFDVSRHAVAIAKKLLGARRARPT